MTNLMADCLEIEAALLNMNGDSLKSRLQDSAADWYAYILEKHDISIEQFKLEIKAWQKDPYKWGEILDSTEQILVRRRDAAEHP